LKSPGGSGFLVREVFVGGWGRSRFQPKPEAKRGPLKMKNRA